MQESDIAAKTELVLTIDRIIVSLNWHIEHHNAQCPRLNVDLPVEGAAHKICHAIFVSFWNPFRISVGRFNVRSWIWLMPRNTIIYYYFRANSGANSGTNFGANSDVKGRCHFDANSGANLVPSSVPTLVPMLRCHLSVPTLVPTPMPTLMPTPCHSFSGAIFFLFSSFFSLFSFFFFPSSFFFFLGGVPILVPTPMPPQLLWCQLRCQLMCQLNWGTITSN